MTAAHDMARRGWIINLSNSEFTREETRTQEPAIVFDDGEPVFEVWFWHHGIGKWFVMAAVPDPRYVAQGVIYFRPDEVPDVLRARMQVLEMQHGFTRPSR